MDRGGSSESSGAVLTVVYLLVFCPVPLAGALNVGVCVVQEGFAAQLRLLFLQLAGGRVELLLCFPCLLYVDVDQQRG